MTHRIVLAPPARRAIENGLPVAVAAAAWEFINGPLSEMPFRVGKPLRGALEGLWSARRGQYRVLYHIDGEAVLVTVVSTTGSEQDCCGARHPGEPNVDRCRATTSVTSRRKLVEEDVGDLLAELGTSCGERGIAGLPEVLGRGGGGQIGVADVEEAGLLEVGHRHAPAALLVRVEAVLHHVAQRPPGQLPGSERACGFAA